MTFLFLFVNNPSTISPQEYFGESYDEALIYCQSNRAELTNFFTAYQIDPALACAIVFPELVRYNRFRDFLETSALELAYIKGGKNLADFSIGRFQMKPSFVEMLEQEVLKNDSLRFQFTKIVNYPEGLTDSQVREQRIIRLKQQKWQQLYLACFIKLASLRFNEELVKYPQNNLLIFSSSYNLGIYATYNDLLRVANLKTFPYGKNSTARFSYYDVASFFFTNHSNQTLINYENKVIVNVGNNCHFPFFYRGV